MRCWIAMPPPSALMRSMLRGVIVSAWSMMKRVPSGVSAVHPFDDVEEARDRLVVGRVDAEGPPVAGEQLDDGLELGVHDWSELGPRLEEVLEVGRRPSRFSPAPFIRKHGIAPARRRHPTQRR